MEVNCRPPRVNSGSNGVEFRHYHVVTPNVNFGHTFWISGSRIKIMKANFRPLRFASMYGVIFRAPGFDFWSLKADLGLREVDF